MTNIGRKASWLLACCLAGLLAKTAMSEEERPVVETRYGRVRGVRTKFANIFKGIPFAMPPIGLLRWNPPQAPPSWHPEIREAVDDPAACPQMNCDDSNPENICPKKSSEDCLYLSVFTPAGAKNGSDLPVMVFIHGGNFFYLDANSYLFDGQVLAERGNVIQVNINYRLGALGFLVTGSDSGDAKGNYGLYDQQLALKWVKENIRQFGGDPEKVTLFGQSAGAQSVLVHMTSSDSSPYFRNAIIESAPNSLPFKTFSEAFVLGGLFAETLGCAVRDMNCMRSKTDAQVTVAAHKTRSSLASIKILEIFEPYGPTVDGSLVKGQPLDIYKQGAFARKPLLIGTTTEETVLFVYSAWNQTVAMEEYIALLAAFDPIDILQVGEHYPPQLYPPDNREMIAKLATDFIFTCTARNLSRTILKETQAKNQSQNIWMYVWDHAMSFPGWQQITFCEGRVCHGSEMPFVFSTAPLGNFTFTADERILSDDVMAYWTNFAWTGDPNMSGYSTKGRQLNYVGRTRYLAKWPLYSVENTWPAIVFKTPANQVVSSFQQSACDFWDSVSYKKPIQ